MPKLIAKVGSVASALITFILSLAAMLIAELVIVGARVHPETDAPGFQAGNGFIVLGILFALLPIELFVSVWLSAIVHEKISKRFKH